MNIVSVCDFKLEMDLPDGLVSDCHSMCFNIWSLPNEQPVKSWLGRVMMKIYDWTPSLCLHCNIIEVKFW